MSYLNAMYGLELSVVQRQGRMVESDYDDDEIIVCRENDTIDDCCTEQPTLIYSTSCSFVYDEYQLRMQDFLSAVETCRQE